MWSVLLQRISNLKSILSSASYSIFSDSAEASWSVSQNINEVLLFLLSCLKKLIVSIFFFAVRLFSRWLLASCHLFIPAGCFLLSLRISKKKQHQTQTINVFERSFVFHSITGVPAFRYLKIIFLLARQLQQMMRLKYLKVNINS